MIRFVLLCFICSCNYTLSWEYFFDWLFIVLNNSFLVCSFKTNWFALSSQIICLAIWSLEKQTNYCKFCIIHDYKIHIQIDAQEAWIISSNFCISILLCSSNLISTSNWCLVIVAHFDFSIVSGLNKTSFVEKQFQNKQFSGKKNHV